jgi:hypothetical protein
VCPSDVKEIRFFTALTEGDGVLPPLDSYARHFTECGAADHRLEASPQYFHGGGPVVSAMRSVLPSAHVIVLLRDPVERLWSTFRFMRSRLADLPPDMTFESYVDACLAVRARREPLSAENRLYWTIQGGFYEEYLDPWLEGFGDRFRLVFFEQMVADPAGTVRSLVSWLGLEQDPVEGFTYSVENRTVQVRSAFLQRIALLFNREDVLGRRRRIKAPLRRAYYALNRRAEPEGMRPETRRSLEQLFAPGNAALAHRLAALDYTDLPGWLSSARRGAP